jgi:glycosyltransferase involved in cell wall biosynthesis
MATGNQKILVSIVMPIFNVEAYLGTAIESALNQTYRNFELILINDCSPDRSFNLAQQYRSDNRLKFFSNSENKGLPYTRNVGIQQAKGEYIALLDSDDVWLPDFLEFQVKILTENPDISLLGCDFDMIDECGNDITPDEVKQARINRDSSTILIEYPIQHLIYKSPIVPSTWLARANVIRKTGLFKEHLKVCEDHELILSLSMLGKVCETNRVLALYRKHSSQLTSKGERFLEYRAKAFDSFLENFPDAPARIGTDKFKKRMSELHQVAGDHFYWDKKNYKEARNSYLKSIRYSTMDFSRWRNLLIALIPTRLQQLLRKYLG